MRAVKWHSAYQISQNVVVNRMTRCDNRFDRHPNRVAPNVFEQLPESAQCRRCDYDLLHATDEQITAVEVSLLRIAKVWT